jgi:Nuclease subunit of the excinuclease complex
MSHPLKEAAAGLPDKPGVYLFKNARGEPVYIGKARSLVDRVKSYFQPTDDPKVRNILAETVRLDFILTASEREAAFLENNFIHHLQPKFNLRLKDDKSFPYLRLMVRDSVPGLFFQPEGRRLRRSPVLRPVQSRPGGGKNPPAAHEILPAADLRRSCLPHPPAPLPRIRDRELFGPVRRKDQP